jgi:hypothetical protein
MEGLGHPGPVAQIEELSGRGGQIVLVMGSTNMGEELAGSVPEIV